MAWSNAEKERVAKLEREVKTLHEENGTLKNGLKAAVNEIQSLHKENNDLRTHINLLNYQNDSLGQYGRKESLRVQKAPEAVGETEDAEAIVLESANFVLSQIKSDDMFSEFKDFKVTRNDLQRCHRVGDKEKAIKRKKQRPIIAKFKDYRLRMAILLNKKKLEKNREFKAQGRFFTEDLTPFRNKLLWYTKNHVKDAHGKDMFYHVHTRDGKIKAKKVGGNSDQKWITITTPDDFHRHGHDVDVTLLNSDFHQFKILQNLPHDTSHITKLIDSLEKNHN